MFTPPEAQKAMLGGIGVGRGGTVEDVRGRRGLVLAGRCRVHQRHHRRHRLGRRVPATRSCSPPSRAAGGTTTCARRTGSSGTRRPARREFPPAARPAGTDAGWTPRGVRCVDRARPPGLRAGDPRRGCGGPDERPLRSSCPRVRRRYAGLGPREGARSWMLRGRLFQQALTEAVWAVTIGDAALTAAATRDRRAMPTPSPKRPARPATRWLPTAVPSNYTAWLAAAGAGLHGAKTRAARRLTAGLYAHVFAATTPDGWQWESSTYYHSSSCGPTATRWGRAGRHGTGHRARADRRDGRRAAGDRHARRVAAVAARRP